MVSKSRHEEKNGTITFEAVHDGYHSRKLGGLVHRRIQLNRSHFEVKDFTNSADQLKQDFISILTQKLTSHREINDVVILLLVQGMFTI